MLAIGIDEAVNEGLLARLVRPGGGWHVCVESEDWLDEVLTMAMHRIVPPVLSRLRVSGPGIDATSQAPLPAPDCFPTRPVTLWATAAAGQTTITVSGNLPDGASWTQTIPITRGTTPAIVRCWARARIRDLEDRHAIRADSELAAAILACSLANGVLSRFTAFVAVDTEVTTGGTSTTNVQPLPGPHGWDVTEERTRVGASFGAAIRSVSAPSPMQMALSAECDLASPKKTSPGNARTSMSRRVVQQAPPPPPTCDAAAVATLHQQLADLAGDQLGTALLLRRAVTIRLLAGLCAALTAQQAATPVITALRAALARCAPPATIAAVAAESLAVRAALDLLLPLLLVGGTPTAGAPKRTGWWR